MVLKLFNFLARWGGRGLPPGGLNRVKARLSTKPLNSRVTWRPFEVRVFELGSPVSKETGYEPSQTEE